MGQMNWIAALLSDAPGTPSVTRLALLVVLGLVVAAVVRWVALGEDIPRGVGDLLALALGATAASKAVQKFAEVKAP